MGSAPTPARIERVLSPSEIAAANNLTRRWFEARERPPAAASALGVWPLLTALADGAAGRTRTELLAAAGVDSDRARSIAGSLLEAAAEAPGLHLAIGAWASAALTLDPEWVAGLPVEAVGTLSGDASADRSELDAWASRATDGLIEQMPVDLDQDLDLLLASALLVRTTWATEFQDIEHPFRTGPWSGLGPVRHLTALIHDDVLRVGEQASILTVPGNDDIDVLLALGREDLSPAEVVSALVEAASDPRWGRSSSELAVGERGIGVTVEQYRASAEQTGPEVAVRTVRFSVSADLDLTEDAEALGLVQATDEDRARFDRLAAQPTYVDQARQSCTATFSAKGFEAAAVTTIAMMRAAGIPRMDHVRQKATITFDRPFAYAARHRPSGLILVAGWVDEPERAG